MSEIEMREVFSRRGANLLGPYCLKVKPGTITAILGPNGAGKSTLLGLLSGNIHPISGSILFDTKLIHDCSKRELANIRAVLQQQFHLQFPFIVKEVIRMGTYALGPKGQKKSLLAAEEYAELFGLKELLHRSIEQLSGGEQQRVHIVRVLTHAHTLPFIFLDEPTQGLDLKYQRIFFELMKKFKQEGKAIVTILHDLNMANQYADSFVFVKNGQLSKLEKLSKEDCEKFFETNFKVGSFLEEDQRKFYF